METPERDPRGAADGPLNRMVPICQTETSSENGQLKLPDRPGEEPVAAEAQRLLSIAEYW